jgi:hypothetical protein
MGFVWAWFVLPETKGRSLEELDELFLNVSTSPLLRRKLTLIVLQGVSVREFKSFQCSGFITHEKNGTVTTAELGDAKHVTVHAEKQSA